ncbi:polysaccharide biosynthesis tyrosine autokinase [Pleurocapsa sp. PCC 7319]|uniref:GumC family protein n=1 Tax=Pleurocapsa sp. PCC 7319 TaxID=118161 RepID=UPI0003467B60|nr:polysaccharide biosynthesis tyrosine autokinase [Pleurocapsa sp. PCC 7319]
MDSNLHLEEYIDFGRYWQVLRRRWIPATATFAGILALSLVAALASEDVYQAEAQLLIKPDRTSKLIGLENGSEEIKGLTQDKDPVETEAKILQSRSTVVKLIRELGLKDDDGEPLTYKDVAKHLNAEPIIGTDLLQITFSDPDPEVAVSFVKRALELYSEGNTLYSRSETVAARNFISKQLPKAEATVKEAEANLRQFKNRNRTANLVEETTTTIDSIATVANQIDQTEAELKAVNARYSKLTSQLGMTWQEASAVSSLSQSLGVQRVFSQLQDVNVAIAQKRGYLSDNAPQIVRLKQEQADLTALLEEQIANTLGERGRNLANKVNILSLGELERSQLADFADLGLRKEGLEEKLASLKNTYAAYQEKSDNLPQLQEQQRELQRQVDAAQSTYETLLGKLREAEIAEQRNVGKVRIVSDAAIAEDPVNPDGKVIVAAGAMMGALFGMALAFILDLKDNTIKNTQEVESMFAYPLHGIVPNLNLTGDSKQMRLPGSGTANLPEQIISDVSMIPLKEAYQNIQVNLKLLDADAKKQVIAITSSVPQEGKSSVSANLAISRAQCGQKILLIDADMRRPTQHNIWEIPNQVGLSNVLNQKIKWEDSIQNVMPNLDVLTAGSISDNPIALLDSSFIKAFIDNVSKHYDQVIFDTPPIIGIADTKMIGRLVDGFLFVVRPGVADYGSATAAKKMLDSTGQKVLGVIVNGADMNREPYYYNSYYYAKDNLETAN